MYFKNQALKIPRLAHTAQPPDPPVGLRIQIGA